MITSSPHDVASTVEQLAAALGRRGITLFATVDHAAGARDAGLELADEVLLIFGTPAAGTPLMRLDARVGLDLPLRMLVWSEAGSVCIAFRDPAELARDHDVGSRGDVLVGMRTVLDELAAEAAG